MHSLQQQQAQPQTTRMAVAATCTAADNMHGSGGDTHGPQQQHAQPQTTPTVAATTCMAADNTHGLQQ
jgi:hypothetical protein